MKKKHPYHERKAQELNNLSNMYRCYCYNDCSHHHDVYWITVCLLLLKNLKLLYYEEKGKFHYQKPSKNA